MSSLSTPEIPVCPGSSGDRGRAPEKLSFSFSPECLLSAPVLDYKKRRVSDSLIQGELGLDQIFSPPAFPESTFRRPRTYVQRRRGRRIVSHRRHYTTSTKMGPQYALHASLSSRCRRTDETTDNSLLSGMGSWVTTHFASKHGSESILRRAAACMNKKAPADVSSRSARS